MFNRGSTHHRKPKTENRTSQSSRTEKWREREELRRDVILSDAATIDVTALSLPLEPRIYEGHKHPAIAEPIGQRKPKDVAIIPISVIR